MRFFDRLKGYEQLRDIVRRDYPILSGHALEEYFRRKFAESGQWTRVGSWWDRKGENELDILAENELTGVPIVAVTADVDVESTYDMSLFAKVIAKPVTAAKLHSMFEGITFPK